MPAGYDVEHLAWDHTESVTLEVVSRAGVSQSVHVGIAKRRAIRSAQKSPSGGVYLGHEVNWHLPKRELPDGVVPKPADVVVDGEDERWTILTRNKNRLGETYALGCVNLTLAHDLRDTVVIERATIGRDQSGAAVKVFDRVLATCQARVQEITQEIASERGMRYARGRYEVTVDRQLSVDVTEDRVRWSERGVTRYLDIIGYRNAQRIDELPVLECHLL